MLTHLVLVTAYMAGPSALPDALDHLKSAEIKPNIGLLLDSSCSMAESSGRIYTDCSWYAGLYNGGNTFMTKQHVMKAVLAGCRAPGDGLLDRYADRANFSMYHFGNGTAKRLAHFGSDVNTLKSAALTIPASGDTPMSNAIRIHATYFQSQLNDSNTAQCRPNFLLLLSDGNPNGGGATYNFNCPVPGDPREKRSVAANRPWLGSDYIYSHKDILCSVGGNQSISTYTIGFGAAGSFSPSNLQNIAKSGGGLYFYAADFAQLDYAFDSILKAMSSRTGLFYAAPAIQTQSGMFSDNVLYAAAFRPTTRGRWNGTVKKHCIEPRRLSSGKYDPSDNKCLFTSPDGDALYTNPVATDLWTGTATTAATTGGSAALLLSRLTSDGFAPKTPLYPRQLLTWRPQEKKYVSVRRDVLTVDETWTSPDAHKSLINVLHGYGSALQANGDPAQVAAWPLGDPVHSPLGILRYGDCNVGPGRCFIAVGMNDGQLHFFDAYSGHETSALLPWEFLGLNGVAASQIRDLDDQPSEDFTHRYFVDGGLVVMHEDQNGDGVIQPTEPASLLFGLGRGGAAMYKIDMRRFNGVLDSDVNPVYPLVHTTGTAYQEIEATFATPWVGRARVQGQRKNVAAFPSGHIPEFDRVDWPVPSQKISQLKLAEVSHPSCTAFATSAGFPSSACAYWHTSGYADPSPMDLKFGPIRQTRGRAYRFQFSSFNIDPKDQILLEDSQGNFIMDLKTVGGGWTAWVYDREFYVRVITDGKKTTHRGFQIGAVEVRTTEPRSFQDHNPSVFMVDVDTWTGNLPFRDQSAETGLLVQFARKCTATTGICVDAGHNPDLKEMTCPISSDVAVFTVGGIADSLYWGDECGQIWKGYRVDGDGSAWKARRLIALNDTNGKLSKQAKVAEVSSGGSTNSYQTGGQFFQLSAGAGQSKDFRKLFRRLEIVSSTCPGKRVVGVYFGTGNLQRPAAFDELQDGSLNNGRDIVGVVWDSPDLPSNAGTSQLEDVSTKAKVDPKSLAAAGKYGWYLNLRRNERMLRDPLVLEGLAYFKTYEPLSTAQECSIARGRDRVYVVDNCSAEAFLDRNGNGVKEAGERTAWEGNDEIGGNLLLVTPPDGPPIVSHGSLQTAENARLAEYRRSRVPSIFSWREPRGI